MQTTTRFGSKIRTILARPVVCVTDCQMRHRRICALSARVCSPHVLLHPFPSAPSFAHSSVRAQCRLVCACQCHTQTKTRCWWVVLSFPCCCCFHFTLLFAASFTIIIILPPRLTAPTQLCMKHIVNKYMCKQLSTSLVGALSVNDVYCCPLTSLSSCHYNGSAPTNI